MGVSVGVRRLAPLLEGALREEGRVTHPVQVRPGLSQFLRWEKKEGKLAWGPRRAAAAKELRARAARSEMGRKESVRP